MVVADVAGSESEIAALTVLDRLVVSLSRAGVARVIVVGERPRRLARATALGLPVEHAVRVPFLAEAVLVATGNVLVGVADVKAVLEQRGRLVTREGGRLPLGVVGGLGEDWIARLDLAPGIVAGDLAVAVSPEAGAEIERAYWASLTSSSDGWVDRHFNRPVGRLLSRRLVRTRISPNQVSVTAILTGLVAAVLFGLGGWGMGLAGALVLQLSAVLDCVDGDLARALCKQSALGKWLDIVGDQVVHIGVFLGIGVGLWRSGSTAPVVVLGIVAAAGVVVSFLVVLRALVNPGLRGASRLQRLIDATTNRDFSVLLILFALFGILDRFLWLAAVGAHVFWLVAAGVQFWGGWGDERHEKRV